MLVLIGGAMAVAVFVGAAGGAINGRLKGELPLGAIVVAGAYVLLVATLESWSDWKLALFGMLPLMLSFLAGSLSGRFLETRLGVRPRFAMVVSFGGALLVGFAYLMLVRLGWDALMEPGTAWIALAILSLLVVWSVQRRMFAKK
jgi:hypothetical protein